MKVKINPLLLIAAAIPIGALYLAMRRPEQQAQQASFAGTGTQPASNTQTSFSYTR